MNCAFLSMESLEGFVCYDHLVFDPLKKLGWHAEEVSWHNLDQDWNQYQLVIIRSPWDYQQDSERFLSALEAIENSDAELANSLSIVKWNINKQYLQSLEEKGVEIVPTIWKKSIIEAELEGYFNAFSTEEIIIKPCISANADDTYRLSRTDLPQMSSRLVQCFEDRDCMIQPFMSAIVDEGEYSLFYFNGELSHGILKKPADNDFRVQEDHGGRLTKIIPEALLIKEAENVLSAIGERLLYARLDFIRTKTGFALMEAELIEPSLYFNLDEESPMKFAKAIVDFVGLVERGTRR